MANGFLAKQGKIRIPLMTHVYCLALTLNLFLFTRVGYASPCPPLDVKDHQAAMMWGRLAEASIVGVYDQPVRLSQGQFIGAPFVVGGQSRPVLNLWPELFWTGDLAGQGGEEIIAFLSETSGGSGERVYLLAARFSSTTVTALPAYLIGDRVKVRALQVKDRKIFLDIVEAEDLEPLCCGTTLSRLVFTLEPQGLRLREKKLVGRLSLKIIEGQTWRLVDNSSTGGQPDSDCTTLVIQGERVTVQIGDHIYMGKIVESAPGQIVIYQLTSSTTDHDSPEAQSFLIRLASVTHYTFVAGRLTFVGLGADHPGVLKFTPLK